MNPDNTEEAGNAKPGWSRFWTIAVASVVILSSSILLIASKTSPRVKPFLSDRLKRSTALEEQPAEPVTLLEERHDFLLTEKMGEEERNLQNAYCQSRGGSCTAGLTVCCENLSCGVSKTCENCFSPEAVVAGREGPIRMKDLRVGEEVWTGKRFQPVYSFAHKHGNIPTNFLSLKTTASKAPLEVTGNHLLYVSGKADPVRAADIQVGDKLVGLNQDTDVATVLQVKSIVRGGLYAPLTSDGMVVVNDVLASTYVNYAPFNALSPYISYGLQDRYQHAAFFPYRMFCSLVGCENESYDETTGYSKYGSAWMGLVEWLSDHALLLSAALYLVGAPLDWVLESKVFEQLGLQVVLRTFVLLFVAGPIWLIGWLVIELVKNPMHLGAGLAGVLAWKKWSSTNGGKGNTGPQELK